VYDLFKFIHIVAVIVWIGAGVTFLILNTRLAAARDHAGVKALASQSEWFGKRVFSVAAAVTLIAGIIMVLVSDDTVAGFADLWITIGFVGIALSIVFGAVLSQRAGNELEAVVAADGPESSQVAVLQRRLNLYGAIDLAILLVVVAAMVWKW
jgi:uncharacterized membrane protein